MGRTNGSNQRVIGRTKARKSPTDLDTWPQERRECHRGPSKCIVVGSQRSNFAAHSNNKGKCRCSGYAARGCCRPRSSEIETRAPATELTTEAADQYGMVRSYSVHGTSPVRQPRYVAGQRQPVSTVRHRSAGVIRRRAER